MTFLTACTTSTCFFVSGRQLSLSDNGWLSVVEGGGMVKEGGAGEFGVELVGLASKGNGQVMSLPSVQKGLILSYRYHCPFAFKPLAQ